ncbi:MAG TPA: TetR family transcriptional regulator [Sporichthyaceae bacterium]|nr:TetR family transcriptional regulator [Sporichthyaceae bacterium]
MEFARARSEEQREVRRQVILETAAGMLAEMPVAELSLNELSRRVGLAKSNVLRYFESREDVLLQLLDRAARLWLADVLEELPRTVRAGRSAKRRGDQLAEVLSTTLRRHTVLCDLISAQPAVLEHNVSADVVLRFKQAGYDGLELLAAEVRRHVPELGAEAGRICLLALVLAGAFWSYSCLSPATIEAYARDPRLSEFSIDLGPALEQTLATLIAGTLARG